MQRSGIRINIGCGPSPTPGWLNYDNSLSVRLAKHPVFTSILERLGFLNQKNLEVISVAKSQGIQWADAATQIRLPDNSVEVLYSSHMLEHLDRNSTQRFLSEAYRVLIPGGIIRICVPDLRKMADRYLREGDADTFVEDTMLATPTEGGFVERLRNIAVGERHHKWMYDEKSLCRLLSDRGFRRPIALRPGSTTIANPGELDLYERANTSVYVEAAK